jgi:hypothetical protein
MHHFLMKTSPHAMPSFITTSKSRYTHMLLVIMTSLSKFYVSGLRKGLDEFRYATKFVLIDILFMVFPYISNLAFWFLWVSEPGKPKKTRKNQKTRELENLGPISQKPHISMYYKNLRNQ